MTLAAAAAIALIAGGQPGEARAADGTTDVTVQIAEGDENLAWSVPTQIPMKATAGGTLIGPDADAIAIRNLSALPIRVKQMDTTAEAPFNLVDNVDKSNGNNDFQMAMNGVVAKQTVELADDGTWAMGYAGNGDGSDVLPLTVSAAKIARVTADLSTAKKAATITWTVEPTEHAVKQDPQPDPENGGAFAVYSEDDKSLDLYKRDSKPEVGDTFNGKAVTKIIDIDETDASDRKASPFQEVDSVASKVEVVDGGIRPISTLCWFAKFESLASINVIKLDVSNDSYMKEMFWTCSKLTSLDFSGWDTSNVTDMSGMFASCSKLPALDLSNFNTSAVTNMSYMFQWCAVASLDLSSFDTSAVTSMYRMYDNCNKLQQVKLGDKFAWKGEYLPTPSSTYIPGANGKWYAKSDQQGYTPANVPANKADTYYASKDLLPKLEAFAVFSADDRSLNFYKRSSIPKAGEKFEGKTATEVYTGIEKSNYGYNVPWQSKCSSITNSKVVDAIKPTSTAYWFNDCKNLTVLDLSNLNTSSVTSMHWMFSGCKKLGGLNLSSFDTSSVTDMNGMFGDCGAITLALSNFDTSSVTDMTCMFGGCDKLDILDLSNFDTSSVTNMYGMFENCNSLTTLDLPSSFDTSAVTDMRYMFSNCNKLTSLDFSNFDTSSVTRMDGMLFYCSGLQQVKLGDKFVWKNGHECGLPTPSDDIPGADGYWYAASNNKSYAPNRIPSNKADTYCASKNLLPNFKETFAVFSADDNSLNFYSRKSAPKTGKKFEGKTVTAVYKEIELSNYDYSAPWYSKCTTITSVKVVDAIKPISTAYWFDGFESLASLDLSNLDTSSATDMSYMFKGCSYLTSLDLSSFDTSSVTNMSHMFEGCWHGGDMPNEFFGLTSLNLSGWNTSSVTNMNGMFKDCFALTSINGLSSWDTSSVTDMSSMFDSCNNTDGAMTPINLDVSGWNTSSVTNMNGMFAYCYSADMNLSSWNTSNVTDMGAMFYYNPGITSIGDVSGWDTSNVTDMNGMFYYCSELTVDCSNWNVSNVTEHNYFNEETPGVTEPKWAA